jgi:hypothetical protein
MKRALVVGLVILGALLVVVGCGGSQRAAVSVTGTTKMASTGLPCSAYPDAKPVSCLTPAQRRAAAARAKAQAKADAKAQAKAAKEAATAAAAARAKALAQSIAQGKALLRANAWHSGYFQQDDNVFWEWRNGGSCQSFATNGCWHVAVITRNGCSSYVAVNANEYHGSAIVGQLLANQGYGIPPKTVRLFELDADTSGVTANNVKVDCQ